VYLQQASAATFTTENSVVYSYHLSFLSLGKINRKQMLHYRFLKAELYSIFHCYLLFNL